MEPQEKFAVIAAMALKRLDDDELLALNIAAQLDLDPREVIGYEKAAGVFTVPTASGYNKAHDLVKDAFAAEVMRRFPDQAGEG